MPIRPACLLMAMNRSILICVLATMLLLPVHATKRALIIGIGAYPESTGWAKINGDKDVATVEQMLIGKGFTKTNIIKLVNAQATSAGIRAALENLIQVSGKNDFVYIHFSGHGQRMTDTSGDEPSGYDEAWVPYDAQFAYEEASGLFVKKGGYQGQNHLVDDEINEYLYRLRQKVGRDGRIIVIADACHSQGATRLSDDDDEFEGEVWVARGTSLRGSNDDFIIPNPSHSAQTGGHSIDWIYISACKSTQSNFEYRGVGSLTYVLTQLSGQFETLDCATLEKKIRAIIRDIIPFTQTPYVESPNPQSKFF